MAGAAAIGREIRAELSRTMASVMTLAQDNLRNSTPVDTTHASNNWILTVGKPSTLVDGSRVSPSTTLQDAGIRRMDTYDIGKDGPIYVRNNVLYLQFLDRGHSQQAPAGFVAVAMTNATRRAPHGRKQAVRKMLRNMARQAYLKTY